MTIMLFSMRHQMIIIRETQQRQQKNPAAAAIASETDELCHNGVCVV